jgi:hypothetical protein
MAERNDLIVRTVRAGQPVASVAERHGVTVARVRQIVQRAEKLAAQERIAESAQSCATPGCAKRARGDAFCSRPHAEAFYSAQT